jgi:phosphoserine phosphatase RsbU/P
MPLTTQIISPRIQKMSALLREISTARTPQEGAFIYGKTERQFFPTDGLISVSTRDLEPGHYKITRQYTDGKFPTEPADPWSSWQDLQLHSCGFIAECIATGLPQCINDLDIANDPVLGDSIKHFRSCLALPVWDHGIPINWAFAFQRERNGFDEIEFERRLMSFNLHGRATKNLVSLTQIKNLNEQLNSQLERVAMIQRALLPDKTPSIPAVEVATSFLPCDESGGDFFDFRELPGGQWGVILADVSGHGAGAATVAAMLYTIFYTFPGDATDPAAVLTYCNEHLCRKRIESCFATAIYIVLDPASRTLRLANAGHFPPRLKHAASNKITGIDGPSGLPLGVLEDRSYESYKYQLSKGDTVVLYTDGIIETRNSDGLFFSHDRLDTSLADCSGRPDCIIDTVHAALYDFTNARTRDDDQTLISLQIHHEDPGQ